MVDEVNERRARKKPTGVRTATLRKEALRAKRERDSTKPQEKRAASKLDDARCDYRFRSPFSQEFPVNANGTTFL